MDQIFQLNQQVCGMNIFKFIDWADRSLCSRDAIDGPVVGIPPLQRSVLWRPHQIVDLWDSVLRGFPIGSMLMQERECGRTTRRDDKTVIESQHGFDLLDGQQRAIALLLGWTPTNKDKCLWIDFSQPVPKGKKFALYLTSKAQPFGYKPNGDRHGVDERRQARKHFDEETKGAFSATYDHDLLDLPQLKFWPRKPKPSGAKHAVPLDLALKACLAQSKRDWRVICQNDYELPFDKSDVTERIDKFHETVELIRNSEIALIKVAMVIKPEELRLLFDRVGQNGTVLSKEEQLYSILKQNDPYAFDVVHRLCNTAGHILSPSKIVMAAIRCSSVATDPKKNVSTPSPEGFQRLFKEIDFKRELRKLIPEGGEELTPARDSLPDASDIARLSEILVNALKFKGDNDIGLPSVLFPAFGGRLYEILIFWLFHNCDNDIRRAQKITENSRDELLRFVLFWLVFIENADRGADCALKYLITKKFENFPENDVYLEVVRGDGRGQNARSLIKKERFAAVIAPDSPAQFRPKDQRFRDPSENNEKSFLVQRFWGARTRLLPWIQRRYLQTKFTEYKPLLGYENEVPFDYDHICAQKEVGAWNVYWKDRDFLRDSIGNFWILHGSLNRSLGGLNVQDKLSGSDIQDLDDRQTFFEAREEAFGENVLPLWMKLNASNGIWPAERGADFQDAVEKRTIWLYERFYDELDFQSWQDRPVA